MTENLPSQYWEADRVPESSIAYASGNFDSVKGESAMIRNIKLRSESTGVQMYALGSESVQGLPFKSLSDRSDTSH